MQEENELPVDTKSNDEKNLEFENLSVVGTKTSVSQSLFISVIILSSYTRLDNFYHFIIISLYFAFYLLLSLFVCLLSVHALRFYC